MSNQDSVALLAAFVSTVVGGGTPARSVPSNWTGSIPWASVKDLPHDDLVLDDTEEHISVRALQESAANLIPAGTPVVCTRMAVGRVATSTVDMAINQDLKALFPAHGVDSRYLLHGIHFLQPQLEAVATGSTVKGLQVRDLLTFRFRKPVISEQRRIAEILDALDDQIRFTRELLAKLRCQAEGLLDDLVADISDVHREPLAALCVADICYGIVQSGEFVPNGVPVLSIRDLSGDFETGLHRTSRSIDARYRRSRVHPGDVLLSIKGTIGRVGVAPQHYVGNVSRELARLRFGTQVLPEFARIYFLSREAQRRLDLAVVGTTRAEVSIHVLKRFWFPVPSLADQGRVIKIYRSIERQILSERECLAKLLTMRSGLADDLLTGRVRVPSDAAS